MRRARSDMTICSPGIGITGIGLVTALGRSARETFKAVCRGEVGIGALPALEQRPNPEKGGGEALALPDDFAPGLSRAGRYLRFVIEQALSEADLVSPPASLRLAVVLGSTLHGMRAGGEFLRSGSPAHLRRFLAGAVLEEAVASLPVGPIRLTTCAACSSGLSSVGLGLTLLDADLADVVIAGGYDTVSEYAYAGFNSLRLIASGPLRPFAADREGMKVAEGFAALVLERIDRAEARGRTPIALIAGCGESSDAHHLTQPEPTGRGIAAAARIALAQAEVRPEEVGVIAAHATGTPNNDAAEYAGLSAALGADLARVPVVAYKGHLGHTLGAAGAVELALSATALEQGVIPPTPGTGRLDPDFTDLRLVTGQPLRAQLDASLDISLGFGGANAAVVLRRSEAPRRPRAVAEAVVVTGVGVVLLGAVGRARFQALLERGEAPVPGPLPDADYQHLLAARRTRRMSEYAKLSLAAACDAFAHAGLQPASPQAAECCGVLGTTHGSTSFCELYYSEVVRDGIAAANPALFAEGVPNVAAAHLSMALGLKGGCQTLIGTRSAGLEALILATLRIGQGAWRRAIVCAAEEHSPTVEAAYRACCEPGEAKPLLSGAGAVAFVLESAEAAAARGRSALCTLDRGAWLEPDADTRKWRAWTDLPLLRLPADCCPGRGGAAATKPIVELFSVAPLATLAAGLLTGRADFAVSASDSTGRGAGIRVRGAASISSLPASPGRSKLRP